MDGFPLVESRVAWPSNANWHLAALYFFFSRVESRIVLIAVFHTYYFIFIYFILFVGTWQAMRLVWHAESATIENKIKKKNTIKRHLAVIWKTTSLIFYQNLYHFSLLFINRYVS